MTAKTNKILSVREYELHSCLAQAFKKRASNFRHPDGEDSAVDEIAGAMRPHVVKLVDTNIGIYDSDDMKKVGSM